MLNLTYKGITYAVSSIDAAIEALGGMAKVFAVDPSGQYETLITMKDGSIARVW